MIEHKNSDLWVIQAHTIYSPAIKDSAVVVDFGASDGVFSEAISGATGCHCYAVEASPMNFAEIEASDRIDKFHYAISGSDGHVEFSTVEGYKHRGTLVLPVDATSTAVVQSKSLETFFKEIDVDEVDLLKIDIEGAEIEMFRSTTDETLSKIKQITIEFHDFIDPSTKSDVDGIIHRLETLGFLSISFNRKNRCDVLFLNSRYIKVSVPVFIYYKYVLKYVRGIHRIFSRL